MSILSSRTIGSAPIKADKRKQENMTMREVELFAPVKKYFESIGATVYAEIGSHMRLCGIDLVARNGDELACVELKMSLSRAVIHSAYNNAWACEKSYVGIPTNPRKTSVEECRRLGVGIIRITDRVDILLEPNWKHKIIQIHKDHLLKQCVGTPYETIGGLPTMKGVGPRIDCAERVKEYLLKNPDATWKQIYADVQNHYCSYASMRGAVGEYI